jgi:hypothetical protein
VIYLTHEEAEERRKKQRLEDRPFLEAWKDSTKEEMDHLLALEDLFNTQEESMEAQPKHGEYE